MVNAFIDEKFPTVIALNKIDHQDADKVGQSQRICSLAMSMALQDTLFHYHECGVLTIDTCDEEYSQDGKDARSAKHRPYVCNK